MSLSLTNPITTRSVPHSACCSWSAMYWKPPGLCPVSHIVSGCSSTFIHRPIKPVVLQTDAKPSCTFPSVMMNPFSRSRQTACSTVSALSVWHSPANSSEMSPNERVERCRLSTERLKSVISELSCANTIGAFTLCAFSSNTGRVSSVYSPTTTGVFGFIMPAFSPAIAASVSPRN